MSKDAGTNRDAEGSDSHERHEPYAWHEPTAPHDQNHTQSHAGNGTVNHDGPEDPSPEGLDSDELTLRTLLHQAVQTVEPRDGTLDHLRKAVPVRRARKRQAVVGMAAAALFIGTAVPALLHVSNSTGSGVNPSAVGQASQAQGGAGSGKDADGNESTAGGASGRTEDKGPGGAKGGDQGKGAGTAQGGTSGTGPSATTAAAPVCTAVQLGNATGTSAAADAAGAVYGTFSVVNLSTAACTVGGPGTVTALAQGAADQGKIGTARHLAGDAASGLPDPSTETTALVLQPGSAYEVKFAWVPSETCPTTGTSDGGNTGEPSPDPSSTDSTGTSSGTTSGTTDGTTSQLLTDGGTADGSVEVSNTAESGSPTVSTVVGNACAGTVFYTGVLAPGA
ncbi:hypothetical protein M2283_002018 [Streptomyces pseudovenezuelae]|uniref:DUF4232 domain-containing protein n=1 Tax=Streptomyces pseudovenezuelae TaxID=67350 RepID=A0ABT6LFL2_9ACTN|nr:hypothetical protein [Streptomyces pseudovenezuelae]MDH6214735.1 hypothetical protein [Streptomyces pseudovenezuelae]